MHGDGRALTDADAVTVIAEAEQRIEILLEWCRQNAVEISPKLDLAVVQPDDRAHDVDVQNTPHVHIGVLLKAGESLAVDDILAVIPKQATFSKRTCSLAVSHPSAWRDFIASVEGYAIVIESPAAEVLVLATALAFEIAQGSESRWYGYLQSIRPSIGYPDLPAFWTGDNQARLWRQGSDVQNLILYQRSSESRIALFYEGFVRLLAADIGHPNSPDLALFLQAYALVSSRAFWIDNYRGLAMVPIADAFNHTSDNDVSLQTDDQVCDQCGRFASCSHRSQLQETRDGDAIDGVEMICVRPRLAEPSAASEVFNTYGKLSNSFLLANYGFRLDDNEDDRLHWWKAEECVHQALSMDANTAKEVCHDWRRQLSPIDQRTPDHELLYIDADGIASLHLESLLAIAAKAARTQHTSQELLRKLCEARLDSMYKPNYELAKLADIAYAEDIPRNLQLALQQTLGERQLLRACIESTSESHHEE